MRSIRVDGGADLKSTPVEPSKTSQAPATRRQSSDLDKQQGIQLFPDVTISRKSRVIGSVEDVRKLVIEMIAQSYPELKHRKIRVVTRPFHDRLASMNSRPRIGTLLPSMETRFVIEVNENVFGRHMTEEIARGYLAHELAHTVYYCKLGTAGVLAGLASELGRMVFGYRFMAGWERATDLEAVRRGYGPELKTSFEWYLSFLTPEERAQKLKRYLSPEEIVLAMESPRDAPIWRELRNNWPE